MKTCFLFPGQGSQFPGMGKDLYDTSPVVKELFDQASDIMERDMSRLLFEGTPEELGRTDLTQPAVTLVNLAARQVLKEKGVLSQGCAGHSLGEYAAYADAEVLNPAEVLQIVSRRGLLMHEAGLKASVGQGSGAPVSSMAAVIGLEAEAVTALLQDIPGAYAANFNAPTQIVLAGTPEGLKKAEEACKEAGARRFLMLKVSAPCHTPLLEEARTGLAAMLESFTFRDPVKNLYSNVTGKKISSGQEARELALKQMISPVRWVEEEMSIRHDGYERLLETGPGKVLTGLWKSISRDPAARPCGTAAAIAELS